MVNSSKTSTGIITASVFVGNVHDSSFEYGRVFVEDVLELTRPHFVAGDVDLVFDAVDQVHPALLVHNRAVARPPIFG